MTRHVFPSPADDKTFLTIPSICRRTTVAIHRSPGIIGFPYKYRHFYDFHVNLLSWYSLASQHTFYQPKNEFLLTERTKNHLRNPPRYAMLYVGQKYKHFRYPHETSQTYVGSYLGQKQYLAGEVGEKLFNPTLMNKLIRIK